MPSIRFHVDRVDPGLADQVRESYGAAARITEIEEIRTGGVGGFFARRRFEVTVEVPAAAAPRADAHTDARPSAPAAGLADLLDRAEEAEARALVTERALSTESSAFESLLDDLGTQVGDLPLRTPAHPIVPVFPSEPGALVVVAGLVGDSLTAARGLARRHPLSTVYAGGAIEADLPRVDDRRAALSARSDCVTDRTVAVTAFGLGDGLGIEARAAALRALAPDQLWLAVDVSRKADDTARWVSALRSAVPVHALAVVAGVHTASADSATPLGVAIGWSELVR